MHRGFTIPTGCSNGFKSFSIAMLLLKKLYELLMLAVKEIKLIEKKTMPA
jgi:hypothetical protein